MPSPYRFDAKGGVIFNSVDPIGCKFIGIIGSYLPYKDVAVSTQTGNPRVVFEENTGLSQVWSVEFVNDLRQYSFDFNVQINKVHNMIKKNT